MAEEIIFDLEVNTKGAAKSLDKVEGSVEDIGKAATKTAKSTKSFGKTLASLGKSAGIVGILVTAFEALKEALGNNQKVMDVLNTATTAISIVFNDLFNLVADNIQPAIEYVSNLFADLPGTFDKVKEAIKNNLEVRFNALIDTLGYLGDAITKVFSGDFSGALESAGEAGKSYVDILTGVEGTVDKVVEGTSNLIDKTIEYTKETIASADAITQNEKSLRMLELQQTRLRESADRDAERQRQIRDDYTKGIDERIAANNRLAEVLDEQERLEKKTVTDRIAALQREQNQLGVTQERREEIYALNTELAAIEAQQEGFRSEQQKNAIDLQKEKIELLGFQTIAEKEAYDAEVEAAKDKQAKLDDIAAKALAKEEADAKKRKELEKQVGDAKVNLAISAANAIQQFTSEGSELGKAAAVAATVIDTIRGAQSAFANTAGGLAVKLGAAAVATAIGIANVKKIVGTKIPGGGATSAPNISNTAAVAPPNFDIAQTNQNQLADTINSTNGNPIKAYVVGSEVTSQQQMDRIETANATL